MRARICLMRLMRAWDILGAVEGGRVVAVW